MTSCLRSRALLISHLLAVASTLFGVACARSLEKAEHVILSAAKDLKIHRCRNSRSFVVCATQDDGGIDSSVT